MKPKKIKNSGYSLIELILVVMIMSILFTILLPRFDLIMLQAHESTTKSRLGDLRTLISIYYSDNEGIWPLAYEAPGTAHTAKGLSLHDLLIPKYQSRLLKMSTKDRSLVVNGITQNYDIQYLANMAKSPPEDVEIDLGAPGPIAGVTRPFLYNNQSGYIYVANDNYDRTNVRYYFW